MVPDGSEWWGDERALGHVRTLCSARKSRLPGGLMCIAQGWTTVRWARVSSGWKIMCALSSNAIVFVLEKNNVIEIVMMNGIRSMTNQ